MPPKIFNIEDATKNRTARRAYSRPRCLAFAPEKKPAKTGKNRTFFGACLDLQRLAKMVFGIKTDAKNRFFEYKSRRVLWPRRSTRSTKDLHEFFVACVP